MKKLQLFRYLATLFSSIIFSFCASQDNLVPGESISANQTLTSSLGTFALGFFTPQNSTKYYLGIWYNTVPSRDIVWVANRQSPLDSPGFFTLGEDGNLVVLDEAHKAMIWSSNVSLAGSVKNGTACLLMDSGNLILKFGGEIIWESFHHPTDTLLPGMKISLNKRTGQQRSLTSWAALNDPRPGKFTLGIDPTGRGQIFIWKESKPYVRSTFFFGKGTRTAFQVDGKNAPSTDGTAISFTHNFDTDEVYFTYGVSDSSLKFRASLNPNGLYEGELWSDFNRTWFLLGELPVDNCDIYAHCGPYGACQKNENVSATCRCLTGFSPKFPKQWAMKNWSGGCVREEPLKCDNRTEWYFSKFERLKPPDNYVPLDNKSNMNECQSTCGQDCFCTAFAYVNSTEGSDIGKCLTWFGDLVDIVENDALGSDIYVRVHNSEQGVKGPRDNSRRRKSLVIPIVSATVGMLTIIFIYFLWKKTWGKRREYSEIIRSGCAGAGQSDIELPLFGLKSILAAGVAILLGLIFVVLKRAAGVAILLGLIFVVLKRRKRVIGKAGEGSLVSYEYRDLQDVTKNFSEKLGGGGFGSVFKGTLPDSSVIAVKKLDSISQGEKQFRTEVSTIGTINHVNLVRLRGFCSEGTKRLLVYDYMPNGSLDAQLFNRPSDVLDWRTRYQIALGTARGLAYLHEKCRDCIIHCDIKPENILLDAELCPKVADFGLAKLVGREFSRVLTTMRGTRGYLAPEWISGEAITAKADVYSYGMMLFEIVSGRRNSNQSVCPNGKIRFFPSWAAGIITSTEEGDVLSLLDPKLERNGDVEEVIRVVRVACWCIQDDEAQRPSMGQVVQILEGVLDVNLPSIPRTLQVFGDHQDNIVFFTESSTSQSSNVPSNNISTASSQSKSTTSSTVSKRSEEHQTST